MLFIAEKRSTFVVSLVAALMWSSKVQLEFACSVGLGWPAIAK